MKILCVLCRDPFIESDGANYAIRSNLKLLEKKHEVFLAGYGETFSNEFVGNYKSYGSLGILSNSKSEFLWEIFNGRSYTVRKYSNIDSQKKFISIISDGGFDCIWFEQTQSAFLLFGINSNNLFKKLEIVLRPHNIEGNVISGALKVNSIISKFFLKLESKALIKSEIKLFNLMKFIGAISTEDVNFIKKNIINKSIFLDFLPVVPDFSDSSYKILNKKSHSNYIVFVGNCSWGPNKRAADWIVDVLSPCLLRSLPSIKIHMIGKGMLSSSFKGEMPNVRFLGYVEDIDAEYANAICAIAPITDGGGVNIKVIDALAHGVPVIGSEFAKRGISSLAYIPASSPEEYVSHINKFISNDEYYNDLIKNAGGFINSSKENAVYFLEKINDSCYENKI